MSSKNQEIVHYYEECETHYRIFWDLDHSLAMHAGFWDASTKNLRQALERENAILAKIANITPQDRVLDAGCGVGGSALYLARHIGCHVTGITLSEKQRQQAERHGAQRLTANTPLPTFYVMDFTCTDFPNESFDVVWGVESICHAANKEDFVKEAFRLLKPGGRLIMADAFQVKHEMEAQESHWMRTWLKGWGVEALESEEAFQHYLKKAGFHSVAFLDMTSQVLPSSKRLYFYSYPGLVMAKMNQWVFKGSPLHATNLMSARYQYKTLRKGLWKYGVFSAHKE